MHRLLRALLCAGLLAFVGALPRSASAQVAGYVSVFGQRTFFHGYNELESTRVNFGIGPDNGDHTITHRVPTGAASGVGLDFIVGSSDTWWARALIKRTDSQDLIRLRKFLINAGAGPVGVRWIRDSAPTYSSLELEDVGDGVVIAPHDGPAEMRLEALAAYWRIWGASKVGVQRIVSTSPVMVGLYDEQEADNRFDKGVRHVTVDPRYRLTTWGVFLGYDTTENYVLHPDDAFAVVEFGNGFFSIDLETFVGVGSPDWSEESRDAVEEITGRSTTYASNSYIWWDNELRPVVGLVWEGATTAAVSLSWGVRHRVFMGGGAFSMDGGLNLPMAEDETELAAIDPTLQWGGNQWVQQGPRIQLTIGMD
jgi:hypothetical protein